MNWIESYVRPKLQALVSKDHNDSAENKWQSCPSCNQMVFNADLPKALYMCQHCQHHLRMPAPERIKSILDEGYEMLPEPIVEEDPLGFKDLKKYSDRLKSTRNSLQTNDVVHSAYGSILGTKAVVSVFDFRFMGGSMGSAAGASFVKGVEKAITENCGFVVFTSSGGARMQEGILSLMQLPRSTVALEILHQAKLPYIVVLCDPTTGGVSASFAMLGDIQIAEPGATIGFAGRRVIEQTLRETLPEGFQQAEQLIEKGVIDMIVPRTELPKRLSLLLRLLHSPKGQEVSTPQAKDTSSDETLKVAKAVVSSADADKNA